MELSAKQPEESRFPTTKWTLIFEISDGSPEAKERALDVLCRSYWLPIYAFVRRKRSSREEAEDLTQGFFQKIISGDQLTKATAARGKLRTFLLACVENYMHDEWQRENRQKRGGSVQVVTIDAANADALLAICVSDQLSPEKAFDQAWAMTLIDAIHGQLEAEFAARGRTREFKVMRDYLAWNERQRSYAEGAAELGISEDALKQGVRRMRQRFGQLLRRQLAYTTETEEQIEEEIRSLFAAFR